MGAVMSVGESLKGGLKSGLGSAWAVTKKIGIKLAIAAGIVAVVMALIEHGEGSAAEPVSEGEGVAAVAQPAILFEAGYDEQLLLCRYEVDALFGVSIFADKHWGSKRLLRLRGGEEVYGSCFARQGDRALSCDGLAWDYEWLRVRSGTTVGWSPVSCFERVGFL
ncbi:hypothetical protein GCM10029992_63820 [Glycomyces albus]